jgi:hypothetical protein
VKKPTMMNLLSAGMQLKVENGPINVLCKQIVAKIDEKKDLPTFKLRYKALFEKDLINDLDEFYEDYE